ncbi:hypothetical protein ST47_g3706 [Ascochyta rabiei]|uniref:Uncharacterized protein n=1 Tax=Didymella rabiei TaxID=5454 RepID=A0A163H3I2_DIDRA|nr:hypothetical protein ST47_g3706 [Ascochyta rabiei]
MVMPAQKHQYDFEKDSMTMPIEACADSSFSSLPRCIGLQQIFQPSSSLIIVLRAAACFRSHSTQDLTGFSVLGCGGAFLSSTPMRTQRGLHYLSIKINHRKSPHSLIPNNPMLTYPSRRRRCCLVRRAPESDLREIFHNHSIVLPEQWTTEFGPSVVASSSRAAVAASDCLDNAPVQVAGTPGSSMLKQGRRAAGMHTAVV